MTPRVDGRPLRRHNPLDGAGIEGNALLTHRVRGDDITLLNQRKPDRPKGINLHVDVVQLLGKVEILFGDLAGLLDIASVDIHTAEPIEHLEELRRGLHL
jgi:hypothetical protein